MTLTAIDYGIIGIYLVIVLIIGAAFWKRASSGTAEFFISGRSLPWWIAGTSMVATTFAADTPLAVVGLTAKHGLAGNWFWWSFALGGMITVFVYSQLWRRAEVMTDVQLISMRYGGKPASLLRYIRALYISLIVNPIIIGWVVGAMLTVLEQTVFYSPDISPEQATMYSWLVVLAMMAMVAIYATLSGMWGVAVADMVQFGLAMIGCIWLAIVAVDHVGGVSNLESQVLENSGNPQAFQFMPSFSQENAWMPLHIFVILAGIQWWATWYPGAEPGGGGYVVQRMASAKNEKHALLATCWYQVAHYCLRPWPWILVAFAAIAMYPDLVKLDKPDVGFPMVMRDVCPPGLRGLMLVTFFAAFMSTISTQMNWGASYLVNDFLLPLFWKKADDRKQASVSRWASMFVVILGLIASYLVSISGKGVDDIWKILAALGAGSGAVYMLRWFWWRINAWTEISAMLASLVYFLLLSTPTFTEMWKKQFNQEPRAEEIMSLVAVLTIATWVIITFVTPKEQESTLTEFFRKTRPFAAGWKPIASKNPHVKTDDDIGKRIVAALLGATMVYSILPGTGYLIFQQYTSAAIALSIAAAAGVGLVVMISKLNLGEPVGPGDENGS